MARLPAGIRMFPQLLREAGYYCTNNRKEDYNFAKPGQVWDESSRRRTGGIATEQPFFAVFNTTVSHESQIRKRPHKAVHDPAKVRVPAYHPDTPMVRQDWAQYYDRLTEMDTFDGAQLAELKRLVWPTTRSCSISATTDRHAAQQAVAQEFRAARAAGGLLSTRHFAERRDRVSAGGSRSDRLVRFVDLALTVLALQGVAGPGISGGGVPWPDRPDRTVPLRRPVPDG